MRIWKNDFKTSNDTELWYDLEEDWSLIEASLAKQYGVRIMPNTPLRKYCSNP